ncbi:MAG: hypothetical protein AAF967_09340 [Pseudomonadota bacterium]
MQRHNKPCDWLSYCAPISPPSVLLTSYDETMVTFDEHIESMGRKGGIFVASWGPLDVRYWHSAGLNVRAGDV